jgi:hypothetical protein
MAAHQRGSVARRHRLRRALCVARRAAPRLRSATSRARQQRAFARRALAHRSRHHRCALRVAFVAGDVIFAGMHSCRRGQHNNARNIACAARESMKENENSVAAKEKYPQKENWPGGVGVKKQARRREMAKIVSQQRQSAKAA